ncbi:MAG: hypothetical protein HOO88_00080 [Kiritimatiellaceae bacterium]|nr:hypothetical protein [Kiritimatiellaceae bacterium]
MFAALAIRFCLIPLYPGFRFPDEHWYAEIAQNLLAGKGYVMAGDGVQRFAICKAPALPFTLAGWGFLFPLTAISIKIVNALLSWFGIVFLTRAAIRLSNSRWPALLTALFAGFHPAVLFASLTNYPQNGQLLCIGLLVWNLARRERLSFCGMITDGMLIGLGALFVPTHIYAVPAVLTFYGVRGTVEGRASKHDRPAALLLKGAAALFVGGLITVSPWLIRNAFVEKAFIPFTATAGQQFYTGFNKEAGMNTGTKVGCSDEMIADLRAAQTGRKFEAVHWTYAMKWVEENRLAAAKLWGLKFLNWFRWDNGTLNTEQAQAGAGSVWIQRLSSVFVLVVCVTGCVRRWPKEKRWPLFIAVLMLANAFGHAFFISRYRYRLPFEPLLLMAGFCGWGAWMRMLKQKDTVGVTEIQDGTAGLHHEK